MKLLIISDIHGIKNNLEKIKLEFDKLKCDKIVVLGDIYYIGPRNKMIEGYDIQYVKEFLENFKDKLICVRGNCDSDIDIQVSEFPIIDSLGIIKDNNIELYLTHGHIYNEQNWKYKNKILIFGHYHIPFIKQINSNLFINPGSISLPKNNFKPTYLIYDNGTFEIRDIEDTILYKYDLKNI